MFNLLDQLSAEDKVKIENYVHLYGAADHFIGVDEWLVNWAKNKIKLYKLLGGKLIYKVPYKYEKSAEELKKQLRQMNSRSDFPYFFNDWLRYDARDVITDEKVIDAMHLLVRVDTLFEDKIDISIKYKREGAKRELQLQKGMKPMRALSKIMDYFKDVESFGKVTKEFEAYRLKHSLVLNDKVVKGDMVISIHPLDFMTMSDNASNWQSCMSWQEQGCYHVGTIEMMNSNNVVCCYLEGKEPFHFQKKDMEDSEEYTWTNKKWRQLCYVTKDIIVSGKPYPYVSNDLSKALVEALRKLAKENLKWEYSFGVEQYQDMKHITGMYSMNRARDYIRNKDMKKHNILFDSKGMYNDMLNDSCTKYWCVRNKVKHNKIISYSGKATCLCCGESIISWNEDECDYYNDRYENTGSSICMDCENEYFHCSECNCTNATVKHYDYVNPDGSVSRLCERCWQDKVRVCPCCDKPMIVSTSRPKMFARFQEKFDHEEVEADFFRWDYSDRIKESENRYKTVMPVFMHTHCAKALNMEHMHHKNVRGWGHWEVEYDMLPISDKTTYEKYYFSHLKKIEPAEGITLTPMEV